MTIHDEAHLRAAIELSRLAREKGNAPFGSVLVDSSGEIVLEAENTVASTRDVTGHAETNLMRAATQRFDPDFLAGCTLYTSTEPCAMCATAIYWGNVRRVVYALGGEECERTIVAVSPSSPTLALPCREVFARGNHEVVVEGPFLADEALE